MSDLKPAYARSVLLVERLHRRLLELVKSEFDRMQWYDINPTQALMLFALGKEEVRASDFRKRGIYLGTNASYNLQRLEALQYLTKSSSKDDKRVVLIKVTPKGEEVAEVVDELLARHLPPVGDPSDLDSETLNRVNQALDVLDRFWTIRADTFGTRERTAA